MTTTETISATESLVDNWFAYVNRDDDGLKVFLLYKSNIDTKWYTRSCGAQDCLFNNSTDWDTWQDEDFPHCLMSSDEENSFHSAIRKGSYTLENEKYFA